MLWYDMIQYDMIQFKWYETNNMVWYDRLWYNIIGNDVKTWLSFKQFSYIPLSLWDLKSSKSKLTKMKFLLLCAAPALFPNQINTHVPSIDYSDCVQSYEWCFLSITTVPSCYIPVSDKPAQECTETDCRR